MYYMYYNNYNIQIYIFMEDVGHNNQNTGMTFAKAMDLKDR